MGEERKARRRHLPLLPCVVGGAARRQRPPLPSSPPLSSLPPGQQLL